MVILIVLNLPHLFGSMESSDFIAKLSVRDQFVFMIIKSQRGSRAQEAPLPRDSFRCLGVVPSNMYAVGHDLLCIPFGHSMGTKLTYCSAVIPYKPVYTFALV